MFLFFQQNETAKDIAERKNLTDILNILNDPVFKKKGSSSKKKKDLKDVSKYMIITVIIKQIQNNGNTFYRVKQKPIQALKNNGPLTVVIISRTQRNSRNLN